MSHAECMFGHFNRLEEVVLTKAEYAALRKDAERYRWLRHGDNDERVIVKTDTFVYLPRNEKLDNIVDAEIQKEHEALRDLQH